MTERALWCKSMASARCGNEVGDWVVSGRLCHTDTVQCSKSDADPIGTQYNRFPNHPAQLKTAMLEIVLALQKNSWSN